MLTLQILQGKAKDLDFDLTQKDRDQRLGLTPLYIGTQYTRILIYTKNLY